MRYPKLLQRPASFRLNGGSPFAIGLEAAWMGQEPGSTLLRDESQNKYHGTLTNYTGGGNTPTDQWTFDRTLGRNSIGMDGSADYILAGTSNLCTGFNALTLACWYYKTAFRAYGGIISSRGSGNNLVILDQGAASNHLSCFIGFGTGYANIESSTAFATGAWYHVAATVSLGYVPKLYINGTECAYSGGGTTLNNVVAQNDYIPRGYDDAGYYSAGSLADVLIYRRALLPLELSALADPANVDLRMSGVPLVLPLRRTYFPAATTTPIVSGGPYSLSLPTSNGTAVGTLTTTGGLAPVSRFIVSQTKV